MRTFEVLDISVLTAGEKAELLWFDGPAGILPKITSQAPDIILTEGQTLHALKEGEAEITVSFPSASWGKRIRVVPAYKNNNVSALNVNLIDPILSADGIGDEVSRAAVEKAEGYLTESSILVTYGSAPHTLSIQLPLTQPEHQPDPPGYTDYPYWTMFSRRVEERIKSLSIAWRLTGRGDFASKIKEYLLGLASFTRWYEFPVRGTEGNLSNAHFLMAAALGYDTISSLLTDEEAMLIREAMLTRGIRPLAADYENKDMHNIICSKQCALLIGSLVLSENIPSVAAFVNSSRRYLENYLNEKTTAAETEGLLYSAVAVQHVLFAAEALRKKTGDRRLADHCYLTHLLPDQFFWMMGTGSRNEFCNFSDSFYKLDLSSFMYFLAGTAAHPAAAWYTCTYLPESHEQLLYPQSSVKPMSPAEFYSNQSAKAFQQHGIAVLRTGWGEDDSLLAFTSSASARDHNHFDQNHFIFHSGGDWLLTDPGYQDYVPGPGNTFTNGTIGHNSLLVNGEGQKRRGGGGIPSFTELNGWVKVSGEAGESYEGLLHSFLRTILFSKDLGLYLLWDQTEKASEEDTLSFLFHTAAPFEKHGSRMKSITVKGSRHEALLSWPEEEIELQSKVYSGAEKYGCYAEVRPRGDTLLTVIQPSAAGSAHPCSVKWTDSSLFITTKQTGHSWIVRLPERGGKVIIAETTGLQERSYEL